MRSYSRKNIYLLVSTMCICIYKLSSASANFTENTVAPQYLEYLLNTNRFEEFTNILQIPNTHLVDPSHRKTSLQALGAYNGLAFSDILPRPRQVLNPEQHYDFNGIINITINKWKNGIVPYYITNAYFDNEKMFIENEIEENNRVLGPNINFRTYQDGDSDYVLFFKGGCGCYSNLGNVGGPQVISLLSMCLADGAIAHKLQHTLGFGHEINRIDRDFYFRLIHENIPEVLVSNYERYNAESFVNVGPFDHYSITSLPITIPGFDLPAYDILENDIDINEIGKYTSLSPLDILRVKTVYS